MPNAHVLSIIIARVGLPIYTSFTNFSIKYHLMFKVYTDLGGIK